MTWKDLINAFRTTPKPKKIVRQPSHPGGLDFIITSVDDPVYPMYFQPNYKPFYFIRADVVGGKYGIDHEGISVTEEEMEDDAILKKKFLTNYNIQVKSMEEYNRKIAVKARLIGKVIDP